MGLLADLYRPTLALLTDLYQLTMAYAVWRSGAWKDEAVFSTQLPARAVRVRLHRGGGLPAALELLEGLRFTEEDRAYLATLSGADGKPLFEPAFLDALGRLDLGLDVDAVPEGTLVFPQEPLLRVKGPVAACMLAETPLLNLVNFPTLVATKAARVVQAARGEPVLEFGLRRAQGVDGAMTASRAAYLGGCAATSNVLAGRLYGIPVKGTHAHSWVMLFDEERESFQRYAEAMPNNCVFLVDTYDTLQGVRHAVEVGRWLRARGNSAGRPPGLRDLADLSIKARQIPTRALPRRASTPPTTSTRRSSRASSSRTPHRRWGVGTRLVTAFDRPAPGRRLQAGAVRAQGAGVALPREVSEQPAKTSTRACPGAPLRDGPGLRRRRIYNLDAGWQGPREIIHPSIPRCAGHPGGRLDTDLLVRRCARARIVLEARASGGAPAGRRQRSACPRAPKRFMNAHLSGGLDPGCRAAHEDGLEARKVPTPMKLVKVAAATLNTPRGLDGNARALRAALAEPARRRLILAPEECLTGYGCEDAFHMRGCRSGRWRRCAGAPDNRGMVVSVGLPLMHQTACSTPPACRRRARSPGSSPSCTWPATASIRAALVPPLAVRRARVWSRWTAGSRSIGDLLFEVGGVRRASSSARRLGRPRPAGRSREGAWTCCSPQRHPLPIASTRCASGGRRGLARLRGDLLYGTCWTNERAGHLRTAACSWRRTESVRARGPGFSFGDHALAVATIEVDAPARAARTEASSPRVRRRARRARAFASRTARPPPTRTFPTTRTPRRRSSPAPRRGPLRLPAQEPLRGFVVSLSAAATRRWWRPCARDGRARLGVSWAASLPRQAQCTARALEPGRRGGGGRCSRASTQATAQREVTRDYAASIAKVLAPSSSSWT
jgi:nicotinate phosphoribosyltransferase